MITSGIYYFLGILMFAISFALSKRISGRYFSPISIYFIGFFMSTYLDFFIRVSSQDVHFNVANINFQMIYNLACNFMALLGVMIFSLVNFKFSTPNIRGFSSTVDNYDIFKYMAYFFSFCAIIFLFQSGRLETVRGFDNYESVSLSSRLSQIFIYCLYVLTPVLAYDYFQNGNRKNITALTVIILVTFLISATTFGRFGVIFTLVLIAVCALNSNFKIRKRNYIFALVVVLGVQFFSSLRQLGLSPIDLMLNLSIVANNFPLIIASAFLDVGQAVPGQSVFSNVLWIMQDSEFLYGRSYLEAFLGLFGPYAEYFGLETSKGLAFWYKDNYAPYVVDHGFDFSAIAESYVNFSVAGPLIFIIFGGVIVQATKVLQNSKNIILITFAALAIVSLTFSFRHDFVALISRVVNGVILFIAFAMLASLIKATLKKS